MKDIFFDKINFASVLNNMEFGIGTIQSKFIFFAFILKNSDVF